MIRRGVPHAMLGRSPPGSRRGPPRREGRAHGIEGIGAACTQPLMLTASDGHFVTSVRMKLAAHFIWDHRHHRFSSHGSHILSPWFAPRTPHDSRCGCGCCAAGRPLATPQRIADESGARTAVARPGWCPAHSTSEVSHKCTAHSGWRSHRESVEADCTGILHSTLCECCGGGMHMAELPGLAHQIESEIEIKIKIEALLRGCAALVWCNSHCSGSDFDTQWVEGAAS